MMLMTLFCTSDSGPLDSLGSLAGGSRLRTRSGTWGPPAEHGAVRGSNPSRWPWGRGGGRNIFWRISSIGLVFFSVKNFLNKSVKRKKNIRIFRIQIHHMGGEGKMKLKNHGNECSMCLNANGIPNISSLWYFCGKQNGDHTTTSTRVGSGIMDSVEALVTRPRRARA